MKKKLIIKHLTPSQPLVLQNDNIRTIVPAVTIPVTNNIDYKQIASDQIQRKLGVTNSKVIRAPETFTDEEAIKTAFGKVDWSKIPDEYVVNLLEKQINEANQKELERINNSHSEIMSITIYGTKDDITPDQAREYLSSGKVPVAFHSRNMQIGRGMSGADPVGEFVVGNAVLGTPLKLLGKGLLYVTGKYLPKTKLGNWSRAKIISNELNKPISQEALNKVNKIFRTSEWNEFLMTKNGYNYYRLGTPITNGNEMTFLSHTTPWEEFIPKPITEVPAYAELGPKILYEFPHKTFGTFKASGAKPGAFGDVNVQRYGLQHLLYGNYASGERGLVRNMSSKNYMRAKQAGLDVDEFKIGLKKRPLVNGHYDQNPIYENIYNGYQTQIKADDFLKAVKTKPHMTYEYTDNGILKILWNPLTKSAIKTSVIEPETAVTEPLDQIQTFRKRALLKTGKDINDIPVFDLNTNEGRKAASKYLIKKHGLDPGETYDDAYNYYNKILTERSNLKWFKHPVAHLKSGLVHVPKQIPEPYYSSFRVHELGHVLHYPKNPIPKGVLKEAIGQRIGDEKQYFIKNNNTEIAEAINQVLTYHGIDHGNPISGNQLKRMFERYIKNMKQDNTKSFIYRNVANWDGLAKWANDWENVIGLGTPITIGAVTYGNKN